MLTIPKRHMNMAHGPARDQGGAPSGRIFAPLRVGTLSSELQGTEMRLASEGKSVDVIIDALETHSPDVLVTAGYALQDDADIHELEKRLQGSGWDGLAFVEVKEFDGGLPRTVYDGEVLDPHCLFAWTRERGLQLMGRQFFASSAMAREELATRVRDFEENLANRMIEFRGRRFGALICGEINALRGRNTVTAITPEIDTWLRNVDVVVNPTHDLMGNAGTLAAKRRWLSHNGRASISVSNWNTNKPWGEKKKGKFIKQRRDTATLHTVYINGKGITPPRKPDQHQDYEYREAMI